jgi:hypothetical protein
MGDVETGRALTTSSLLTLIAAAGFTAATSFALAQSPNDGLKYPNPNDGLKYRIWNLTNSLRAFATLTTTMSPPYAVTMANKQYKDVRNLDHSNPSPSYAATGTTGTTQRASVSRKPRYVVHALHGAAGQHR